MRGPPLPDVLVCCFRRRCRGCCRGGRHRLYGGCRCSRLCHSCPLCFCLLCCRRPCCWCRGGGLRRLHDQVTGVQVLVPAVLVPAEAVLRCRLLQVAQLVPLLHRREWLRPTAVPAGLRPSQRLPCTALTSRKLMPLALTRKAGREAAAMAEGACACRCAAREQLRSREHVLVAAGLRLTRRAARLCGLHRSASSRASLWDGAHICES